MSSKSHLGLSGIWNIEKSKLKRSKTLRISIFLCLILLVIAIYKDIVYLILEKLCEYALQVFPSVLGFSIGGLALIIAFGDKDILKEIAKKPEGSNETLYQKVMAAFSFVVLSHAITLVYFVIISLSIFISKYFRIFSDIYANAINYFSLLIASFLFIYSLLSVIDLVSSIFTYSQLYHHLLKKLNQDKANN